MTNPPTTPPPAVTSTPGGMVRSDVCSMADGITSLNVRAQSGAPSTDWGLQVLVSSAATRLNREGRLDAITEKYGAIVLPCAELERTALDINATSTGDGYATPLTNLPRPRQQGPVILP